MLHPVRVYLVDYGYHSSLILPDESGGGREFAYGEYGWFANNRDGWLDVFRLIFLPCEGTLGVRDYAAPLTTEAIAAQRWFESVHEILIERESAAALRARLEERYRHGMMRPVIYNPVVDLWFVRDNRVYWVGYNCNHAVSEWLASLGCDIRGLRAFADYEIRRENAAAP